jgi:uncharacterized cupredoxin-like copper-binding protein
MRYVILSCAFYLIAVGTTALQAGTSPSNEPHQRAYETADHDPIGKPNDGAFVDRTIKVSIKETQSGNMLFEPDAIQIASGSVVRFVITNSGALEHEFMLGSFDEIAKHQQWMRKFPDMAHDYANSVSIRSGEVEELVWQFSDVTNMEFACLIPGHREAGMWGVIMVHDHLAPKRQN